MNFPNCHLSIVYAIEDPDDKLEIMNTLITDWIEAHAPLKRTELTRPPAPWLHKDDLRKLPQRRNTLRQQAHETNSESIWQAFRDVRNLLEKKKDQRG